MSKPVFFDPSGRRRRSVRGAVFALLVLVLAASVAFASTVVEVPARLR